MKKTIFISFCLLLAACSGVSLVSRSVKEQTAKTIIDINYPEVSGLPAEALQDVNARLKEIADAAKEDFGRNVEIIERTASGSAAASTLTMTYRVPFKSLKFLSIWFDISMHLKGAPRANEYRLPFNYDVGNRSPVSFSDIFAGSGAALKEISSLALQELINRSKAQGTVTAAEEDWIKTGTLPSADNFRSFTFEKGSLLIWFAPFQTSSSGKSEEVRIPVNALKDFLSDRGSRFLLD